MDDMDGMDLMDSMDLVDSMSATKGIRYAIRH